MMLEMAGRAAQVLVALAGAYLVVLWFALIVWTFRDIEGRSRSVFTQVFSTLLSVLFFVPGVLLYMLLRPKETLDQAFQRSLEEEYLLQDLEELPHCPSCHRYVEDDFVLCPHCHAQLREACGNCDRLVDLRWPLCPYCGVVHSEQNLLEERVEPPATRWTAPGLRRRRRLDGGVRPRTLPSTTSDEHPEVAAAVSRGEPEFTLSRPSDDASSLAASLASGVRSMVRPFDKLLGRGELDATDTAAADDGGYERPSPNGTNGRGSQTTQPEQVIVARNRFATGDQNVDRNGAFRSRDGQRNGANANGIGTDSIVPFPVDPDQARQSSEPAITVWPPVDRDKKS